MAKSTPNTPAAGAPAPRSTSLAVIDPSNYVIMDPNSNLAEVLAENLSDEELDEFDLTHVKVPSGGTTVWAVPEPDGSERNAEAIEGVVLHVGRRRAFWKDKNPSGNPPDCSSKDLVRGMGEPGGDCDKCPNNEFGSATSDGGKPGAGKACKEIRALFIVRPGDHLPMVLNVPPSSLSGFKKYLLGLNVPYSQVITRFTLVKEKNNAGIQYSEIRFSAVGMLPSESVPRLKTYGQILKQTTSGPAARLAAPPPASQPALPSPAGAAAPSEKAPQPAPTT